MNDEVSVRVVKARMELLDIVNQLMIRYQLPAYIMEQTMGSVLADVKQSAVVELMRDMEKNNVNLEQGIHTEKLGKQTVEKDTDK